MAEPTDHAPTRPPSLRAFLDAGCDPEALDWSSEPLVDSLREALLLPPRQRAERAADSRKTAEWILAGGLPVTGLGNGSRGLQNIVKYELWEAELLEDPALVERWVAALSPDAAAKFSAGLDVHRRPHPLKVTTPEQWWSCQNCGAAFDEGETEAVVVGEREDYSDWMKYPLTFCAECIALVADIVRGES